MAKITVQNTQITVIKQNEDDYISLTDMLKHHRVPWNMGAVDESEF